MAAAAVDLVPARAAARVAQAQCASSGAKDDNTPKEDTTSNNLQRFCAIAHVLSPWVPVLALVTSL